MSVSAQAPSGYSYMHVRLINDFKLPIGMIVGVWKCLSTCQPCDQLALSDFSCISPSESWDRLDNEIKIYVVFILYFKQFFQINWIIYPTSCLCLKYPFCIYLFYTTAFQTAICWKNGYEVLSANLTSSFLSSVCCSIFLCDHVTVQFESGEHLALWGLCPDHWQNIRYHIKSFFIPCFFLTQLF